jgi:hypothetical protein
MVIIIIPRAVDFKVSCVCYSLLTEVIKHIYMYNITVICYMYMYMYGGGTLHVAAFAMWKAN